MQRSADNRELGIESGNQTKSNKGRCSNSYSPLDSSTTNPPGRSCSLTAKGKEHVWPALEHFLSLGTSESQQLKQEQHIAPALKLAHAIPCPSFISFHVTFQGIAGRRQSAAAGAVASNQACVQARWSKAEDEFWETQEITLLTVFSGAEILFKYSRKKKENKQCQLQTFSRISNPQSYRFLN